MLGLDSPEMLCPLVLSLVAVTGCAGGGVAPIGPPPDPTRPVVAFSEALVDRQGYALYLRNDSDSPVTITEVRYTECINVRGGCVPLSNPFVIEPGAYRRVDSVEPLDQGRAFRYRWTFRYSSGRMTGAQAGSSAPPPVVIEESDEAKVLLDPRGTFVNLVIPGARPDPSPEFARRVTNILYRSFEDAFDFVLFSFPDGGAPGSPSGRAFRAKRNAAGIGLRIPDDLRGFGSEGRLMGALYLAQQRLLDSPTPLHEIVHLWGQQLLDEPGDEHWGFTGVGGMLGGWEPGTLEEVGEGTWHAKGPDGAPGFLTTGPSRDGIARRVQPYAPLELYLMGLLPADSVPPFRVAHGAEWIVEGSGVFRADSIRTVSIEDLVQRFGERDPRPLAGQEFRAVYVLVSSEPLDGGSRDLINQEVQKLARPGARERRRYLNFWEATGGRATLVMDGLFDVLREPVDGAGPRVGPRQN
jgi:hypothetical protein